MNRRSFVKRCALLGPAVGWPEAFGRMPQLAAAPAGIRRLSSLKRFTLYHARLEPAYTVKPDEVVLVECSHGLPGLVTRDGKFTEAKKDDPVNPGTGPIAVEGIEAGDALAIDILDIRTGDWGYCSGRIFELADGHVRIDKNLKLPLQPMIGQIGVAPAEGEMDSRTPAATGGNMDCREVRAGSTLVFTAQVRGGLVGIGDPHALQGDGEIAGQGIETDAEVVVRFRKLKESLSKRPVILRPDHVATLAAHPDLTEAAWQATDDMVQLLCRTTGRNAKDGRMLVNLLGQLRICQIVDPAKGARMEMPSWLFGLS
jgi:amidase